MVTPETRTAILTAIDEQFDSAVDLLRAMIDEPSVGPWFGEPAEVSGEGGIQALLRARLEAMGARIDEWEPSAQDLAHHAGGPGYFADRDFTGRPNLVGTITPPSVDPEADSLMFLGHCDVVPGGVGWTKAEPFTSTLVDDRIYGRGACDMKGGMAAALAAIEAVQRAGVELSQPLSFGSVTEEETGGMGTLALIDRGYRPGLGIVIPEPTSLKVAPLCRGILWGEITIPGKSGHIEIEQPGWRDGGAVDAIAHGRRLLAAVDELNAAWAELPEKNHRYMPLPCQMNVAVIDAGTYPSSWAGSFTIRFDIQYLPVELDERGGGGLVRAQIEDMLAAFVGEDEWLAENPPVLAWLVDADCGETADTEPIVTAPLAAMRELGMEPVIEGVTSHTDMGLPIKAGVPTVTFGPGFLSVAHQPDEYLDLPEYKQAIRVMALMIADLCGAGGDDD
ncbi:ArgE/DapE family deacylase [Microbacterium oryzae]|uniref:ArgE/DapE family deacylase n=1 Tax=Microbacterium oryzae TaxID=743009 RepID=UPI0025B1D9A3|nr:ArgE/DapE family deacylase [Microbacterium oryzae]MDN3310170.1 ArgE/DapE family deacylase [Microbacterium oryzae]